MVRGRCIAVLGPDGVGKSTLIAALQACLQAKGIPLEKHHWRPALCFPVGEAIEVCEPHGKPPYPIWLGIVKLAYLLICNHLGWWLKVRPVLQRGAWVVYDRAFPDLLCDPRRYRYGGPVRLVRLANRCLPSFDSVVVVLAPTSVIQRRKCEVSAKELLLQLKRYRRYAHAVNALLVDGNQDPQINAARIARNAS